METKGPGTVRGGPVDEGLRLHPAPDIKTPQDRARHEDLGPSAIATPVRYRRMIGTPDTAAHIRQRRAELSTRTVPLSWSPAHNLRGADSYLSPVPGPNLNHQSVSNNAAQRKIAPGRTPPEFFQWFSRTRGEGWRHREAPPEGPSRIYRPFTV